METYSSRLCAEMSLQRAQIAQAAVNHILYLITSMCLGGGEAEGIDSWHSLKIKGDIAEGWATKRIVSH